MSDTKPIILIFSSWYKPFVGGSEIAIAEISFRLKDRYEFHVITHKARRNLPSMENNDGVIIHRVGFGTSLDIRFIFPFLACKEGSRIIRTSRDRNIIIWGVMVSYATIGAFFLKLFYPRIPFLFTIQEGNEEWRFRFRNIGLSALWWRIMFRQVDEATAISVYLKDQLRKVGFQKNITLLPNGINEELLTIKHATRNLRQEKIIFSASRLVYKNGIDILLNACAQLKNEFQFQLVLAGDGEERKRLETLANTLGIRRRVMFLGNLSYQELPRWYRKADLFVRPSRTEGLGNAFLEAMASGIITIGTPVGGIQDFLIDGKTGLLAKAENALNLASVIKRGLIMNEKERQCIISTARTIIQERFLWSSISQVMDHILQGLLINFYNGRLLRVLIATPLYPPDIGGPATYVKVIEDALPLYGFQVMIAPFRFVTHLPKGIRHAVYLLKLVTRAFYADIIFAQDPVSVGFPAMLTAKLLRKKFLIKIVGDYAWEQAVQRFGVYDLLDEFLLHTYGWRISALRAIERIVAKHADCIIVPSNYMKSVVMKWGVSSHRIQVIYNDLLPQRALISKNEARKKLGIPNNAIALVTSGRLVPWKGVDMLIDIMPALCNTFPNIMLYILGDGPEYLFLQKKTDKNNLARHVVFIGACLHGTVIDYLCAADAFLLNTGYEGFSHQLLEAFSLGVPTVTTISGGNREIVEHEKNAIVAEYNKKEKWLSAIDKVLRVQHAKEISLGAKKTALRFQKGAMIRETAITLRNL